MKKKTMYTVTFLASFFIIAACVVIIYLSNGANKDFDVKSNGFSVSYYSENISLFASDEDISAIQNEAQDVIDSVFGVYREDTVSVRFEKEPLKVYKFEPGKDEPYTKIELNRVTNDYTFCPMSDSEECWCTVVADYGIQKRVICFAFYNKDYAQYCKDELGQDVLSASENLPESRLDLTKVSGRVIYDPFSVNYPVYSTNYSFSFSNRENGDIVTDGFIIEKRFENKWYVVEEKMSSQDAKNLPDILALRGVTVKSGEKKVVTLSQPLYKYFDEDKIPQYLSGDYRIIIPYTYEGEKKYSVSISMSIGYDSKVVVQ